CRDIVLSLSARKRLDINMLFADKDKTMSLQQIEHAVRKSVLPDSNNFRYTGSKGSSLLVVSINPEFHR
ncbi:MAG: hypothetical protein IJ355_02445, partial [Prevotella sp.]|nr:hypothetical protein [Prevotella sp.]